MTICEIQGYHSRTFHSLSAIRKGQFCIPQELHRYQIWELQEAVTLLALPTDDFDLVIYLNISGLSSLNLLVTFPSNDSGSHRNDSQASLQKSRFRRGLLRRASDRDFQ
jgi:hypothetical protein